MDPKVAVKEDRALFEAALDELVTCDTRSSSPASTTQLVGQQSSADRIEDWLENVCLAEDDGHAPTSMSKLPDCTNNPQALVTSPGEGSEKPGMSSRHGTHMPRTTAGQASHDSFYNASKKKSRSNAVRRGWEPYRAKAAEDPLSEQRPHEKRPHEKLGEVRRRTHYDQPRVGHSPRAATRPKNQLHLASPLP